LYFIGGVLILILTNIKLHLVKIVGGSVQRLRFGGHSEPSKINCGIGTGDA
jgi:hypothetical protein